MDLYEVFGGWPGSRYPVATHEGSWGIYGGWPLCLKGSRFAWRWLPATEPAAAGIGTLEENRLDHRSQKGRCRGAGFPTRAPVADHGQTELFVEAYALFFPDNYSLL